MKWIKLSRKAKTILTSIFALLFIIYLVMPIYAGHKGIGRRWGPKIYPAGLHSGLYILGWETGNHMAIQPRIGYWLKPDGRPWFYGMSCENDKIDAEYWRKLTEEMKQKYPVESDDR